MGFSRLMALKSISAAERLVGAAGSLVMGPKVPYKGSPVDVLRLVRRVMPRP